MTRPKIYNHIRLFHPNINVFTCELVREWNPASPLMHLPIGLRNTIVEPNTYMAPNTFLNRYAASNYHLNRQQFSKLILAYHPNSTELKVAADLEKHWESRMELEQYEDEG